MKTFVGDIKAIEIDGHIYFDVVDINEGSLNTYMKSIKDHDPGAKAIVHMMVV